MLPGYKCCFWDPDNTDLHSRFTQKEASSKNFNIFDQSSNTSTILPPVFHPRWQPQQASACLACDRKQLCSYRGGWASIVMVSVSFYLGHSYAMTFVTRDKCLLQRVLYLRPKWVAIKAVKVWHAQKSCWLVGQRNPVESATSVFLFLMLALMLARSAASGKQVERGHGVRNLCPWLCPGMIMPSADHPNI